MIDEYRALIPPWQAANEMGVANTLEIRQVGSRICEIEDFAIVRPAPDVAALLFKLDLVVDDVIERCWDLCHAASILALLRADAGRLLASEGPERTVAALKEVSDDTERLAFVREVSDAGGAIYEADGVAFPTLVWADAPPGDGAGVEGARRLLQERWAEMRGRLRLSDYDGHIFAEFRGWRAKVPQG
ncbi:MAG: hypothetical protein AB7M12_06230 [Hyphomonadaceae bacterium]